MSDDFVQRVENLTLSDLGGDLIKQLERECGDDTLKRRYLAQRQGTLEERKGRLEEEAKRLGTYLEDSDGLWEFKRFLLPDKEINRLDLFKNISRPELRNCYADCFPDFDQDPLPDPSMRSVGSASQRKVQGKVDIFNNPWNNQRSHLIPDSPICAPKWGHSAEGALKPLGADIENKNVARKLLVMGHSGIAKLRKKPQNFIKFANHKEVFDVDPSLMIIPIMKLNEVRRWDGTTPYNALVIASDITKPDQDEVCKASSTYKLILSHYIYNDDSFCSPGDISTATELIKVFLLGHAGSLAAGVPISIDPDESDKEKKEVIEDLRKVKTDITEGGGVEVPTLRKDRTPSRPVLKVSFKASNDEVIPDPWLLAAKAAVNLSSTRGQKLLPVCQEDEEEDYELLQELYAYQMRRRQHDVTGEVDFCLIRDMTGTPPPVDRSGAALVTPSDHGGDEDWENFGD